MSDTVFVIGSSDRATQWVDACARSLACPREEAASMLAGLCGFATWDVMLDQMNRLRPSPCDEHLPPAELKRRHARFIKALTEHYAFDPAFSAYIVLMLSPSSEKPFRPFSIDTQKMHGPRDLESGITLADLIPDIEGMDLEGALEGMMGEPLPDGMTLDDIQSVLRLSGEVEAWAWFNLVENLGWNVIEETYDDEAQLGEPAFIVDDVVHGHVPVFLCAAQRTPQDWSDHACETAMDTCLKAHQAGNYGDSAYLIWKGPLYKVIGGEFYCHLGVILVDGKWKDVLLNEHVDSFAKLHSLNAEIVTLDDGHTQLIDPESRLFRAIVQMLAGYGEEGAPTDGWTQLCVNSLSGWQQVLLEHPDYPD